MANSGQLQKGKTGYYVGESTYGTPSYLAAIAAQKKAPTKSVGSYAGSPQEIAATARARQEQAGVRQRAEARQVASQAPRSTWFEDTIASMNRDIAARNRARQQQAAISQIGAQSAAARRANEQRYAQVMAIYDRIIGRAQPGGAFEKSGLAQIETAKTRGVGQEMQQMISSGMFGTTTAAGIGRGWESEVGAPARLRLEDIMQQRLSQAELGKAGFIERREDVYPDISGMLQMLAR